MQEFRINKYLTLKLVGYNTVLYINDESFIQCRRLVLDIPREDMDQYSQLDSIDEAAEIYDHTIHDHEVLREGEDPEFENDEYFSLLSPEEEFWGHCSNLEVWAEHDYDTRLLKANLAFPLLEALADAGDTRAQVRLKEEIIERIKIGYKPVIDYLFIEEYIDLLSNEEFLYGLLVPEEAEILSELQKQLDIEFKFVPSLKSHMKDNMIHKNNEWVDINRKVSIKDNYVAGIDLKYKEFIEVNEELNNLINLKNLLLRGYSSRINSNDLIKSIKKLKNIKKIYLNSYLVKNIEKTELKNIFSLNLKIRGI